MDDTVIDLCEKVSGVNLNYTLNKNLIKDLDSIINEILRKDTFILDIYEICVDCGSDLTWDLDYNVSEDDLKWLREEGFKYFISSIKFRREIKTEQDYQNLVLSYKQLYGLFELSIISY